MDEGECSTTTDSECLYSSLPYYLRFFSPVKGYLAAYQDLKWVRVVGDFEDTIVTHFYKHGGSFISILAAKNVEYAKVSALAVIDVRSEITLQENGLFSGRQEFELVAAISFKKHWRW